MSVLQSALAAAKIKITSYDPDKSRGLDTSVGKMDLRKFSITLLERLGANILKHPEVVEAAHDHDKLHELLKVYIPKDSDGDGEVSIPEDLAGYQLNLDVVTKKKEDRFFLTTKNEHRSDISGETYLLRCNIPPVLAYTKLARPVTPKYRPRSPAGVEEILNGQTKEKVQVFNDYVPAEWAIWREDNPKEWNKLPAKPPTLVLKLLKHLIPLAEERKYLYAWIYASITTRSYVYLMLCGAGGVGKNRLKLLLTGLHGSCNTADGKKSTITERFNSQLPGNTLVWFDELKHDIEMENVMKEIQNDYLSIERKGVDATRSTTIHTSMVISNNKPKDNYLAFDARKFAPLVVGDANLRRSMTDEEIELLSSKIDPRSKGFDPKYVAQVAKWILRIGKYNLDKYPNLEYRGPMFWTLAHTSMTRWQKKAVDLIIDQKPGVRAGWDAAHGAYRWSLLESKLVKRGGPQTVTFPDYSSVKAFFDVFRDGTGTKAFNTKLIPGKNILGDFWIFPLIDHMEIITEATVAMQREKNRMANSDGAKKQKYDL